MGGAQSILWTGQLSDAFFDISIPYAAHIPVWPGDIPFSCGWTARREDGSSVNLAALASSTHAGTHADAPLHVDSAWAPSESLPIDAFVGEALVVTRPSGTNTDAPITLLMLHAMVSQAMKRAVIKAPRRLLCHTGCSVSRGDFPDTWPALDTDATAWLVSSGLVLWGTDAPSVDARTSTTLPVHRTLFTAGAFVLENLALDGVPIGEYELLAQPLAVVGADAAPVRAVLRALQT